MWEYGIICHYGVLNQKRGVRRWQYEDDSPTPAGVIHYRLMRRRAQKEAQKAAKKAEKADNKWIKKNQKSVQKKAERASKKEIEKYKKELAKMMATKRKDGKDAAAYVNKVNQYMAKVMSAKVTDLKTPSGRSVMFVAKRAERGVYMAIYNEGYDISKLGKGVRSDGKVAYRKDTVDFKPT